MGLVDLNLGLALWLVSLDWGLVLLHLGLYLGLLNSACDLTWVLTLDLSAMTSGLDGYDSGTCSLLIRDLTWDLNAFRTCSSVFRTCWFRPWLDLGLVHLHVRFVGLTSDFLVLTWDVFFFILEFSCDFLVLPWDLLVLGLDLMFFPLQTWSSSCSTCWFRPGISLMTSSPSFGTCLFRRLECKIYKTEQMCVCCLWHGPDAD